MDRVSRRELIAALIGVPLGVPHALPAWTAADDLVGLDVTEIVGAVRARQISIAELTDAYLRRVEALNPSFGAFVTVTADRARSDARKAERIAPSPARPLLGVPIAHKDLFETAGIRTTAGSRLYDRYVPHRDADLVRRLARAGTVLLGKTNTHELGGGVTTINPFYGTTRNPWAPARIPGGSSGGSAAAVVAGMAAAATGSDTGGSVRIPAAMCGCVGFKPSFGRLGTRGLLGACPTFDHCGLLTRTVADAAMIYDALDSGNVARANAPSAGRRIGVARNYFFDAMPEDVARAIEDALGVFRTLGYEVRDVSFPIRAETMEEIFDPIIVAEVQARFAADWKTRPEAFSPSFAGLLKIERPPAADVERARSALARFRGEVQTLFQTIDVVAMPTVPMTAPPIEGPIDGVQILRNTCPLNAAGTPAVSVPCGFDRRGLPVGLQLVSAVGEDRSLLHNAGAFEQAAGWSRRRPAV